MMVVYHWVHLFLNSILLLSLVWRMEKVSLWREKRRWKAVDFEAIGHKEEHDNSDVHRPMSMMLHIIFKKWKRNKLMKLMVKNKWLCYIYGPRHIILDFYLKDNVLTSCTICLQIIRITVFYYLINMSILIIWQIFILQIDFLSIYVSVAS